MFCCPICGEALTDDKLLEGYSGVWFCCNQKWTIPSHN